MLSQLISHTNLLLHKINPINFISQKFSDSAVIIAISASPLDLSAVKEQGSIAGFLFCLPFCHSRKNLTDHFVSAHVEFGIAFLIKFLSSSALLGFRKALEQDAMSSSVNRKKRSKHVRDLIFLHTNSYLKCFSHMQICNIHESIIVT